MEGGEDHLAQHARARAPAASTRASMLCSPPASFSLPPLPSAGSTASPLISTLIGSRPRTRSSTSVEQRNLFAGVARAEPGAGVERRAGRRAAARAHRAAAGGGALERVVVDDHRLDGRRRSRRRSRPCRRRPSIASSERRQGVLRRPGGKAAVGDDRRPVEGRLADRPFVRAGKSSSRPAGRDRVGQTLSKCPRVSSREPARKRANS